MSDVLGRVTHLELTEGKGVIPIAIDAKRVTSSEGPFPDLSLRTWRALDASGRVPRGYFISHRKLWRMADLLRWAGWGFPSRAEFEARMQVEGANT